MSITASLDLRTGQSLWTDRRMPPLAHAKLTRDIAVDIAIIGAGISGAMCAEALTEIGYSVVLFDKRGALKGSTAASTSLLLYEIDTPLTQLSRRMGMHKAARAWQRSRAALCNLSDRIEALGIEANCASRPSLYLAGTSMDASQLQEEHSMRLRAGFDCEYLTASALKERYGIHRQAALLTRHALEADPVRLAAGFLKAAIDRGAKLYTPVTIQDIVPHRTGVTLHSDHFRIEAGHVICATGYELPHCLRSKRHQIHSTWAIATKPQPSRLWPERAFVWEASDPYLYLRTTEEGRVICGGEDETFVDEAARDALLPQKIATLERKLSKLFPELDPHAEYGWTGSFGSSSNGLPIIGSIRGMARCYTVMAYGGNGITFSRMAAEIIRNAIRGTRDLDAELFQMRK